MPATANTAFFLKGAPNFRDLGGHATVDGARVRHGRVFRSDVLSRLTDADLGRLAGLGIGLVFDLRLPAERRREQNRWPAGGPVETVSFDDRPEMADAQASRWQELLAAGELDHDGARQMMFGVYRRMPQALALDLAILFERLDAPAPPPVLIHCTGGKDRSGFVCAMLLRALDVPMETIVADYLVSGQRRPPEHFAAERLAAGKPLTGRTAEVLKAFATVDAGYLASAFEQIDGDFGSADAYLQQACALDAERKRRLRATLLAEQ